MMPDAKTLVIDCHAYAGSGQTWANPPRDVDYGSEEILRRGAEAGIDRFCLMPPRNDTYREANRHIAHLCEQHPDQFIGFAAHSPQREAGSLRALLSEEVRSMGLRAVRSDGPPNRELLDAVLDLSIPVIYYPSGRWQQLGHFFHMPAQAYPQVNFILPHLGQYHSLNWAAHYDAIDLVRRYANLYLDMSALGNFKYAEMAARELPSERILFGTNSPELDPRVDREALRLLKLPRNAFVNIAGANLLRLIGA